MVHRVSEAAVEAALNEWMGQAAAFMFNITFGLENQGEPWDERKERLRPWMRAALEAAARVADA